MSFEKLSLDPKIKQSIQEAGYKELTEIQSQAIPKILEGLDIRGSAQTGTGKTAAFLLPLLHQIATSPARAGKGPRALIIAPTRELAMQITEQAMKYSRYLPRIKTVCINGGVAYAIHERKLAKPYDLLIATPGRLVDYLKKKKVSFSSLEVLVLDEADRMLDMGFKEAVDLIIESTPPDRQTILFSATLSKSVLKLSEHILNEPIDIVIHHTTEKHKNIEQSIHFVDDIHHKNRLLDHLLSNNTKGSSVVFTATKKHADQLVSELKEKGFKVLPLHGDMNQGHRTRTIQKLRDGKINILVATDVAARGLDIQSINQVINFDLPRKAEDYVHRIGRTGRAGANGFAFSFAGKKDKELVHRIERFTGYSIDVKEIEGFEQRKTPSKKAFPKKKFFKKPTRPFSFKFQKGNKRAKKKIAK